MHLIISEKEAVSLTPNQINEVVGRITNNFENWLQYTNDCLYRAERIRDSMLYNSRQLGSVAAVAEDADDEAIVLTQVWEQFHTYIANIYKSNFQNYWNLVDVVGRDRISEDNASAQKAHLVSLFREMEIMKVFEDSLYKWAEFGEIFVYVGWHTELRQRRRKGLVEQPIFDPGTQLPIIDAETMQPRKEQVEGFIVENEVKYDGPKAKVLDSKSVVFDHTRKDNWDNCPKIIEAWLPVEDIIDDNVYELTDEDKRDLLALAKTNVDRYPAEKEGFTSRNTSGVKNGKIQVLEYWGDITIGDKVYRDYVITVAAKQKLIRCEPNPLPFNPFVRCVFLEDEYGRGISPISPAVTLNSVASQLMNLQVAAMKLIINKPFLAPENCMDTDIEVVPGRIIEYRTQNIQNTQTPIPLEFHQALVGVDFLQVIQKSIQATTGIYEYATGDTGNAGRTATESTALVSAQNVRLSKDITRINLHLTVPLAEKVAELSAWFNFGDKEARNLGASGERFVGVNDAVRQGNYAYYYGDSQSLAEGEARYKRMFEILSLFSANPMVMQSINWQMLLSKWFDRLQFAEAQDIVVEDELTKLFLQLTAILDPESKNAIAGLLMSYMQQLSGGMNGQVGANPSPGSQGNGEKRGVPGTQERDKSGNIGERQSAAR